MSNYLYTYIAELLTDYFAMAAVTSGERFHVRFEHPEQVRAQYLALEQQQKVAVRSFSYQDYTTYCLDFQRYRLIVAANTDGVAEDFLTNLRNRVSEQGNIDFADAAILFIHNTSLDSIVGGCKSLSESGMPLSSEEVQASISQKVQQLERLQNHEKAMLQLLLSKVGDTADSSYTLFEYGVFLDILGKGWIEQADYRNLGIFPDSGLVFCQTKEEVRKRVEKNSEYYEEVSNGHQYGNLERILEKHFSQDGVDQLQKPEWYQEDFTDLEKWAEEKDQVENVRYLENSRGYTVDFLTYWEKPEEETSAAKQRKRHLVIFNPDHREVINLALQFDGRLKAEGLQSVLGSAGELKAAGKAIHARFTLPHPGQPACRSFAYKHPGVSARYSFYVLILPFQETLIQEYKTEYLLRRRSKELVLELPYPEEGLYFNTGQASLLREVLQAGACYNLREEQSLELVPDGREEDPEELHFTLSAGDMLLPVLLSPGKENVVKPISGNKVWDLKRLKEESFHYTARFDEKKGREVITLTQGTGKFFPTEEFRENLKLESKLIASGHLAHNQTIDGELLPFVLHVDAALGEAYGKIIAYFQEKELLPSLATLDAGLAKLYRAFLEAFLLRLEGLAEGQSLSKAEQDLFRIGMIEELGHERLLKLTPLHPLNIAYQLHFNDTVKTETLPEYLLPSLSPLNLVPLMKGGLKAGSGANYLYQPLEQGHSAEWTYFFCDELSSQRVSRHFVPGLVKEKIEQFVKHFPYLLLDGKAPLKINLINQGDCKEVLEGILLFYATFLQKKGAGKMLPPPAMEVHVYHSEHYFTKFEELALCVDLPSINDLFNGWLSATVKDPEELFLLYNEKVRLYKHGAEMTDYTYCHLSFYQFSHQEVKASYNDVEEVPTGIGLEGLVSDVPSTYQKDSYRTGFGTKYLTEKENILLRLARRYNAFVRVVHTDDQFSPQLANAFVINRETNKTVERVYAKSQWVTFIDPKVDLSFFKSHRDVVIIHYSDQYNNASGYDAITITSKWKPYEATIREVFKSEGISGTDSNVLKLLDIFNAVNGQWLLKLNSVKEGSHYRAEKLSLLSAFKTALAFFYHEAITWIPVSLEEILRVSGAVGLAQRDGQFSLKNLGGSGNHSDDLLMIGLEWQGGRLLMHFYPLEVKVGNNSSTVYTKAQEQGKNTAAVLHRTLIEQEGFTGKVYRNFFAKLAMIGAEKLALYDVWPSYSSRWEQVRSYRRELLNDGFEVSTALAASIGRYGVLSFKSSADYLRRSAEYGEEACVLTLSKEDSLHMLTEDLDSIRRRFEQEEFSPIGKEKLLSNRYRTGVIQPELSPQEAAPASEAAPEVPELVASAQLPSFRTFQEEDIRRINHAIYEKLTAIGVGVRKVLLPDVNFLEGPAFYRIEVQPAPSTTLKRIKGAVEELNMALQLPEEQNVRLFQDMGKVWLEAPKPDDLKTKITTRHLWALFSKDEDFRVPFGLDIEGRLCNLNFSSSNSPHLLLAGTTGSGKSVVLDTLLRGASHFYDPSELQMFLIDPKGNELVDFEDLPHVPEPNGMSSDEAIALLERCVAEMERRYQAFRDIRGVTGKAAKDIITYNRQVLAPDQRIPRWLVVLDEYSDLLDENPANRATIENLLRRLAQMARAAGIHVILATQKPLASIVNSAIKSNLPAVIALKVRTAGDSRVILDDNGAEALAGKGDALYKNGSGQMVRVQCAIYEGA